MNVRPCLTLALCAFSTLPLEAIPQTEIAVSADLAPASASLTHPDPAHPVFYLPVFAGFSEEGGSVAHGEHPPLQKEVERQVELALRRQGYLVGRPGIRVNAAHQVSYQDGTVVMVPPHPPADEPVTLNGPGSIPFTVDMITAGTGPYAIQQSHRSKESHLSSPLVQVLKTQDPVHGRVLQAMPGIVILIQWGDLHAGEFPTGSRGMPAIDFNVGMMVNLMAGDNFDKLDRWDLDEIVQRSHTDRYFIVVSAYEIEGALKGDKKSLLWRTRMSVPSNMNAKFDDRLPLLVHAGEPFFGRATTHPELMAVQLVKEGTVTVGAMEVKDYQEVPPTVPDTGKDRFIPFSFPKK